MARARQHETDARRLLAAERGTIRKEAPVRVALTYPSPYRAAMSSLGYQTIYRVLNGTPGVAADRAMLDVPRTLERDLPIGEYPIVAFSVAYELEIAGVVACLEAAGIPPCAADRDHHHPIVIGGGPLTFSNPAPLGPFCDLIVLGEGEDAIVDVIRAAEDGGFARETVIAALKGTPGIYVPSLDGEVVPSVGQARDEGLPARSQILTPNTELADMYLTEAARGCSRGCTYCVMRRSTNGGMRVIDRDAILAGIPAEATRVGLVGAAVTDHPDIRAIVRGVVDGGRQVGISSLRADKLDDELVGLLAKGGYRTLTVAADGISERMRRVVERSTKEQHLLESARLARAHRLDTLKIYTMVGVPSETDDDVDELIRFTGELVKVHGKIAYGCAPFVAKRHTPLDGTDFAGLDVVEARLARIRRGLAQYSGKAELRATSARWAWVEYMIAQGEQSAGLAIMDAHRAGGSFAAYRRAFDARGVHPTGPRARVPSTSELIALRKRAVTGAPAV